MENKPVPNKNTQLAPIDIKMQTIHTLLIKSKTQLTMALPRHLSADRMLRIAMTSIRRTPKLLNCNQQSLLGAVMQAAQLGLEPDGVLGMAYLVPFKDEVQLLIGYKGLLDLARRSGQLSTICARVVYAKDQFDYNYGLEDKLEHIPAREKGTPDEIVAAYAVAKLKDGGTQVEVMERWQIDEIRERSRSKDDGPWITDFAEMAKKTVLRRLCKMLPASVELARAVALDERAEVGLSQQLEDVVEGQIEVSPKSGNGKPSLADVVEAEGVQS